MSAKLLHISPDLTLPLEAVTQTFGILAKRGVGKTYTAAVFAEELLKARLQVVIVDPIGVWWGLQADAGGKEEGLKIAVLGGEHANLPLLESSGEAVADFIVKSGASFILDLSLFRKAASVRFMIAFAETLYRRNREPLMLIVDEADAFAPQRPLGDDAPRLLGAMEDIVRRGRARGLGCTLITQRSAVLNKNVLTQIEVLICLRTISPQDRASLDEWINVHGTRDQRAELMASLASLPVGEAWFWSPAWLNLFQRVKVRKRETFDSSSTPKVGQKVIEPRKLAEPDLEALGVAMAATVEEARAKDPRALNLRIAALQKELADLQKTKQAPAPKEKRVEVHVLGEPGLRRCEKIADKLEAAAQLARAGCQEIREAIGKTFHPLDVQSAHRPAAPRQVELPRKPALPAPTYEAELHGALQRGLTKGDAEVGRGGLQRILIALAQHPNGLTAKQIGVHAVLSSKGGSFSTYLSRARSAGWIEGNKDGIRITAAGIEALGPFEPLPTGQALFDYWMGQLGDGGASRILRVLVVAYPNAMSKEDVALGANISAAGGSFSTYLSRLRSLELITGTRVLRATDRFFTT